MRWIIIFAFSFLHSLAQNNLVPNPSFELIYSSFVCGADANPSNFEEYWSNVYNWQMPSDPWYCSGPATSDLMCKGFSNWVNYPEGIHNGDHAVHLILDPKKVGPWNEYVLVHLEQTLPENHFFYYEYYYKIFDTETVHYINHDKIGGQLFKEKPWQCSGSAYYNGMLNGDAIYPLMYSKVTKPDGTWIKAQGYFSTWNEREFNWAAFGSFDFDHDAGGKLFIDDIKIIDVNYNFCPTTWLFDNTTFENGYENYQASNQIVIGYGADPEVIDGDVVVKPGSELLLKAGNQVSFLPGFTAELGSVVTAKIAGCDAYPCVFPEYKDLSKKACGGKQILDVFSSTNNSWKVKWSPAQYVDDPYIAEPTFTPPSSGSGEINMTVEVTDLCGNTTSRIYSVFYNSTPVTNATLHITNKKETKYDLSFDVDVNGGSPADIQITISGTSYNFTTTVYPSYPYQWKSTNDQLNSCNKYTVTIKSTNKCSGQVTLQSIVWDRTTTGLTFTGLTNVMNTNDDINNKLYAYCNGADYYETKVYNRWGNLIEQESGRVVTSPAPVFHAKGNYSDGTYYYIVTLWNCRAQTALKSQYFYWFNSAPAALPDSASSPADSTQSFKTDNTISQDSTTNNSVVSNNNTEVSNISVVVDVSPNPNDGDFYVMLKAPGLNQEFNVELIDAQGAVILQNKIIVNNESRFQINVKGAGSGMYLLRLYREGITINKTIIVL